MPEPRSNIALIGMPGAGKSTVGVLLAKRLGMGFVDTDLVIQTAEGRTLQEIVDTAGHLALRPIEEREICNLRVSRHVIATGGSAAYSDLAMAALRAHGRVVYMDVPLPEIQARVTDLDNRGLSMAAGQTLADLYAERTPLYREHADVTIDCAGLDQEQTVNAIVAAVGRDVAP